MHFHADIVNVFAAHAHFFAAFFHVLVNGLPSEPLFTSASNRNRHGRMTTRSISRIAKQALVNSGLNSDRLTAHSLRHTTATLNLLAGASPEETQQLLRHSSLNTTMIYSHHIDRLQNKSAARVGAAIDEAD